MEQETLPLKGQHIVVVVPSYDGRIPINVVNALFGLTALIGANGGEMSFLSQCNMALVQVARNAILAKVMENPSFTGVLHLDADIDFDPMDALRLIAHADEDWDMTAGLYRAKTDKNFLYFVTWKDGVVPDMSEPVHEAERVPLGFAYVKRKVLDQLWANAAHMEYSIGPNKARMVFDCGYVDGVFIGEDYDFCDKVRQAGFRIGALPAIKLGHIGTKVYTGSFADALTEVGKGHIEVIDGSEVTL